MFHYAHLHSPLISSCHCKKLAEIIIGIFAFCTVTGMIALDKCGKHWGMTGSWEMPWWAWHQQFFWALALSCSPVAINSKLTKKSKGFLGLLTSSVEIVFSGGQGNVGASPFSAVFGERKASSPCSGRLYIALSLWYWNFAAAVRVLLMNNIMIGTWSVSYIFIICT